MDGITREHIMSALATAFYNDAKFIEEVNDFTYARKVQLRAKYKHNKQDNGNNKEASL